VWQPQPILSFHFLPPAPRPYCFFTFPPPPTSLSRQIFFPQTRSIADPTFFWNYCPLCYVFSFDPPSKGSFYFFPSATPDLDDFGSPGPPGLPPPCAPNCIVFFPMSPPLVCLMHCLFVQARLALGVFACSPFACTTLFWLVFYKTHLSAVPFVAVFAFSSWPIWRRPRALPWYPLLLQ